jgi:hypothetical protein
MPKTDQNPYPVTSSEREQPNLPVLWWKRFLALNVVLIGLFGAIVFVGLATFGDGIGSLSGITFEGTSGQFLIEVLFVFGLGFGLPNIGLVLWRVVSVKRN